jgi:hypothetical protein
MEKTWKPKTAGILSIVGGVIGLLASLGILIAITALGITEDFMGDWGMYGLPINIVPILCTVGIPMFICGVVAIGGGILGIQRKCFGLALAGSIAAFFPVWVLGLASVILTAISHDEFGQSENTAMVTEKTV